MQWSQRLRVLRLITSEYQSLRARRPDGQDVVVERTTHFDHAAHSTLNINCSLTFIIIIIISWCTSFATNASMPWSSTLRESHSVKVPQNYKMVVKVFHSPLNNMQHFTVLCHQCITMVRTYKLLGYLGFQ